ncbi:uncharacterized protein LOC144010405 [Festucalex cinctus]
MWHGKNVGVSLVFTWNTKGKIPATRTWRSRDSLPSSSSSCCSARVSTFHKITQHFDEYRDENKCRFPEGHQLQVVMEEASSCCPAVITGRMSLAQEFWKTELQDGGGTRLVVLKSQIHTAWLHLCSKTPSRQGLETCCKGTCAASSQSAAY